MPQGVPGFFYLSGMDKISVREIPVSEYMDQYRDAERFMQFCRECGNYGRLWSCPPFSFDVEALLGKWRKALLVAVKFEIPGGTPSSGVMALLQERRIALEARLLAMEQEFGGLAFGFSGMCYRCARCGRADGRKCVHPAEVRPALEAYGFDVCRTMEELFSDPLSWERDGHRPRSLTLVGALFHNCEEGTVHF